jgi:diguanylate cyclase (GGDEF)-like protein
MGGRTPEISHVTHARGPALLASAPMGAQPPKPKTKTSQGNSTRRWHHLYALAGLIATVAYLGRWHTGLAGNALYDLTGLSCAVAIVVGVRLHRATRPSAWYLVALGQLLFVAGDVAWAFYEIVLEVPVPFPSWADTLYLAGYPAITVGVLQFAHARSAGRDRAALIDAAIVTTSAGAYIWIWLMAPYALDPSLTVGERLWSMAYPLGDLVFLAVAARLVLLARQGSRSYAALMGSFLLLLIADIHYGLLTLGGTYVVGTLSPDGIYLASYLFAGWAALHPSMTALTQPRSDEQPRSTRSRLAVLTVALVLMPASMGVEALLGRSVSVPVAIVGSVTLALLVLTRMTGLVADVEGRVEQLETQEGALVAALSDKEALSEQLKQQALHDPLTGAANRLLLADRIDHALARRQRTREPLAILFLDLDDFKSVNDRLGHSAGDGLLTAVAQRLCATVRPGDTVARIGGDEFAVLLEGADHDHAVGVANRIVGELGMPLEADGNLVVVHASVGVALDGPELQDAEDLLRNADVAMYEAKMGGKDRYELFDPHMHSAALERQHIKADLQRAIEQGEFTVFYQPMVELSSGRIVGAEALVRWSHPQRGILSPASFLAVAEESGLAYDIDRLVLAEALRQTALWRQQHEAAKDFKVSVNVSPSHLQRSAFIGEVGALLQSFHLPGEALTIEITETALLRHTDDLFERLESLSELGVQLALDDFGTGFSSLSHLHKLPIGTLKVDKSFVEDLSGGERGTALAHAVNLLGSRLGMVTVAEGVEREEQRDQLQRFGCSWAQGYFFSKPQPAKALEEVLDRGRLAGRDFAEAAP